ncbi:hypothetical protein JW777_01775 [bacterium]|nr:hypothetical protein [bacterium]
MDKKQAHQELAFIQKFMVDSQRALIHNGVFLILLSLFSVLAVALKLFKDFMGLHFNSLYLYIPLIAAGFLFSLFARARLYSKMGGRTYAARVVDGVWTAFLISVFILTIVGSASGGMPPLSVAPVISVLFGISQLICGLLLNSRLITVPAYGWWIASVCMFIWPGERSVVWLGILVVLFQLIPGIFLFFNWKKRNHA